jgi:RNA polymerase sigma factor (sigma-70 family)
LNAKEEQRLIRRCAKNDRKAQKEVYEHFFASMFATCKRYVKNHDDALDVVNMGMLTVFTKIDQFGFQGSFEGWIRRIMINRSLDAIRKKNMRFEPFSVSDQEHLLHAAAVENEVMDQIETAHLHVYLEALPTVHQVVFNLYAVEGFSHEEIAEKLDIKAGTSRWYLSKAREYLKEKIENETTIKPLGHAK